MIKIMYEIVLCIVYKISNEIIYRFIYGHIRSYGTARNTWI